jgi:hypothetical protein
LNPLFIVNPNPIFPADYGSPFSPGNPDVDVLLVNKLLFKLGSDPVFASS